MTNSATADAFGVRPPEQELAAASDPDFTHSAFDQDHSQASGRVATAPKKGGIPVLAWVGIGVLGFVMAIALVIAIIRVINSQGGGQSPKRPPVNSQPVAETPVSPAEKQVTDALMGEVAALKETVYNMQGTQQQLLARLDQIARSAQDAQGIDRKLEAIEKTNQQLRSSMANLDRKVADARPLDADLATREGVRVLSIGAGLARVVDNKSQIERELRKGDRWDGIVVREIRSDRGLVVLSDGTVIR